MMKIKNVLRANGLFLGLVLLCCQSNTHFMAKEVPVPPQKDLSKYEKAYFAGGCFWCVEAVYESVKGVEEVISGYAGGDKADPNYKEVGGGKTGHAESVEIYYDPKVVSYETLLKAFFGSHDPTTLNQQGPDKGPQYRSIAFYRNEKERQQIDQYIKKLKEKKVFNGDITTQVVPFKEFYPAEEYHQNYVRSHPENPYVQNVSIPRLKKFKMNYPELLKEQ